MQSIILFIIVAIAATFYLPTLVASARSSSRLRSLAINVATTLAPAEGVINLLPTAAHAGTVLVKWGADASHYAVCGVNDQPLGIVVSPVLTADLGRTQAVYLLGAWRKPEMLTCSEAIAFTDELYTAASGQVQNLPTVTGTYYKIGRPLSAGANGGQVATQHTYPVAVAVA